MIDPWIAKRGLSCLTKRRLKMDCPFSDDVSDVCHIKIQ
ncbi:hypothetical protein MCC93_13850 [Morococcus cerebrosus]|uniref:Uncharacterized protein n=1 Tax=Morococcus cerebrosus TaxID=1056807 RepID=A0A0C1EFG9_9NEIS|nr:hypothetical protein MCC93_13850 [Morococcus cerebrosus]